MGYVDESKFPKVVTNGYEKDLKNNYEEGLKLLVKEVMKNIITINKSNLKR